MARLAFDRYYAELEAETEKLAATVSDANPNRRVATCPEWTLAQLVRHVGTGHRWAATMVERRVSAPKPMDQSQTPAGAALQSAWLMAGARRLATAVRECGPGTAVWTWAAEQTAGFWLRKMTHDGLIHRFDAELTVGRDGPVAADLAADGVTDLLISISTLSPPDSADPIFAELCGSGQTLHFRGTDPGLGPAGEWLVRRTPTGVSFECRNGPADVSVSGTARQLLLLLNRRIPLDLAGVDVVGDATLFQHWLAHSAF